MSQAENLTLPILILTNLVHNRDFATKALPYIKPDYFEDIGERKVFGLIKEYIDKYNKLPTSEILYIELDSTDLDEQIHKKAKNIIRLYQESCKL